MVLFADDCQSDCHVADCQTTLLPGAKHNDPALIVGAYECLASTLYFLGDFDAAHESAALGVQIWRSGRVQSQVEELMAPGVSCLCFKALSEWHLGEAASYQVTIAEAVSLAKESP